MKKTLIEIGVVVVGLAVLGGLYYHQRESNKKTLYSCPTDVMMCPDGSYTQRSGPSCEFIQCPQELPSYLKKPSAATSSSVNVGLALTPSTKTAKPTFFTKTKSAWGGIIDTFATQTKNQVVTGIQESTRGSGQTVYTPPSKGVANEVRYEVINQTIIKNDNTPIYSIPETKGSGSTVDTTNWNNHTVNAIPVGTVPPVIGAIPVNGTSGKFYISENSFGNIEDCEFSNRIYILDTITGIKTLMYEENNMTIARDDPRACSNEMYLLATEDEKLIFKYHTINTNMICDSTWSEPDKTWYLTVTTLSNGSYRYGISPERYTAAQQMEEECRLKYKEEAASTESVSG